MIKKWDSHTHSEFCKHGSGDPTALMVEKAIKLGFNRYSISEHAPLPVELIPDPSQRSEFSLLANQLDDYFRHIKDLKKLFSNRIEILSGLEIDYLSGFEEYTLDLIQSNTLHLDDLIISLHCIDGTGGLRSIDYTPDDFKEGLLVYHGSIEAVHRRYWETLKRMLKFDFGFHKTKRIGHIGLINKFLRQFPVTVEDLTGIDFFRDIFELVKSNDWSLEFNAAGMSKGYPGNAYLTESMLYWCKNLKIDIMYGSDAHSIDMVGKFYDNYLNNVQE